MFCGSNLMEVGDRKFYCLWQGTSKRVLEHWSQSIWLIVNEVGRHAGRNDQLGFSGVSPNEEEAHCCSDRQQLGGKTVGAQADQRQFDSQTDLPAA